MPRPDQPEAVTPGHVAQQPSHRVLLPTCREDDRSDQQEHPHDQHGAPGERMLDAQRFQNDGTKKADAQKDQLSPPPTKGTSAGSGPLSASPVSAVAVAPGTMTTPTMASPFAPGPSGIRMATAVSTAAASVHVGTNQLRGRRRRSPSAGALPGDGVRVEAATSTSICDLSSSADHGLDHNRCADQSNGEPLIGNVPVGSERQTSWSTRPVRRSNPVAGWHRNSTSTSAASGRPVTGSRPRRRPRSPGGRAGLQSTGWQTTVHRTR